MILYYIIPYHHTFISSHFLTMFSNRTQLVKLVEMSRSQSVMMERMLRMFDENLRREWNPASPVRLRAGPRLVRGCFGPEKICGMVVEIPVGTVANRLTVTNLPDDDVYGFAEAGMVKVEFFDVHGILIECFVTTDAFAEGEEGSG